MVYLSRLSPTSFRVSILKRDAKGSRAASVPWQGKESGKPAYP